MNQKIGLLAAVFIIFAICIAMAGTASAAKTKLVDKGSIKGTDPDMGYYKISWFTYQKGTSYVKTKMFFYMGSIDYTLKYTFVMQKVSKTKLKLTFYGDGVKKRTEYDYTKLTAARYYWREFKPEMTSF